MQMMSQNVSWLWCIQKKESTARRRNTCLLNYTLVCLLASFLPSFLSTFLYYFFIYFFYWDRILLLCCPGWLYFLQIKGFLASAFQVGTTRGTLHLPWPFHVYTIFLLYITKNCYLNSPCGALLRVLIVPLSLYPNYVMETIKERKGLS